MSHIQETSFEESAKECFRVDEETCTFGIINTKGDYKPKSNFLINLDTFVEGGSGTGFFAYVIRKSDRERRLCYYTIDSLSFGKQKFLADIRNTFGSGGFTCSLSDRELIEFHNFLEKSFPFEEEGRVKRGIMHVGKQFPSTGSSVWILRPNLHINEKGELLSLSESEYAWQPIGGPQIELTGGRSSQSFELQCEVCTPLESGLALNSLLKLMRRTLKHNFLPGIFSVAACIMAMHYDKIISLNDSCLIPLLFGESETGKSTAARFALSICGQQDVGHVMKTKGTSDSIIMERIKRSTFPFSLDDPKSMEDIAELLVQLCNGRLCGNLRVGVTKPKSIPILCCNFQVSNIERYSSRVLLIPFNKPTVGPQNDEDSAAFRSINKIQSGASAAVGWAISLGKIMEEEKDYIEGDLSSRVRRRLDVEPRQTIGYTMLLYFAEKLVDEADFMFLKDELEEFLEQQVLPCLKTRSSTLNHVANFTEKSNDNVLEKCLEELASWGLKTKEDVGLYKVKRTMRTETSHVSREVVAVVLDDISNILPVPPDVVKTKIKETNKGDTYINRDFVPPTSTNATIKRTVNSLSRRCIVVWLDVLKPELREKLKEATTEGRSHSLHHIDTAVEEECNTNISSDEINQPPQVTQVDIITERDVVLETPMEGQVNTLQGQGAISSETASEISSSYTEEYIGDLSLPVALLADDDITASTPKRKRKIRSTRSNTRLPDWKKSLNSDEPL